MSLFVVDADVVAKWFVPERLSREAVRLLDEAHELAVPDLLWPELGNVLWKKARAGEITAREASRIVQALEQMPLTVFPFGYAIHWPELDEDISVPGLLGLPD